jgi:hypothetical protein
MSNGTLLAAGGVSTTARQDASPAPVAERIVYLQNRHAPLLSFVLENLSAALIEETARVGPIADTEGMSRLAPGDDATARLVATIPIRRFGRIDEIANIAVFLASDASSLIHGTTIVADGGAWLTRPAIAS